MKNLLAIFGSLILSVLIFLSIPITNYLKLSWIDEPEAKTYQVSASATKLPPKKPKTPPKPKKVRAKKSRQSTPKSVSRSKLVMDLGPGGGSGGATIGGEGDQLSYEEGEADTAPIALRNNPPKYPDKALKAGVGGMVRFKATINVSGKIDISSVDFIECPPNLGFKEEILKVLPSWKFKPAEIDGIPVALSMEFPFEF
jgi:TonB family protein